MAENGGLLPLSRWARMPLAVVAGMVMALGMPPYDLWYLSMAGLVAAFWLFRKTRPGHYAGTGWALGLGYFGFGLGWIVEPFLVDAAVTGWLAPFGLIGMAGGLALFWGLAFWASGRCGGSWLWLVVFWSAAELARGYVLTGFPWALLSYLWLESPAIQWVSVLGPYGLTGITLLGAGLAVQSRRSALGAAAVLVVLLGGGVALTPVLQPLEGRPVLRLIQPNAAQHEKWDPDLIPVFFDRQLGYTEAAPGPLGAPALVVWPETALPMFLHQAEDALRTIAAAGKAPILVGAQRYEAGAYFNALALTNPQGQVTSVYDKHHLVPFGEFMPAPAFWQQINVFGLAARADGGYSPGPGPRLMEVPGLGQALPLICYEAVFPQDVNGIARQADWLLQVTNDAWFGTWSGPYQHLAQARIRAIEQGLPMVRVANTGVSAMIDGAGRMLAELPLGEAGYVDAALPPRLRMTLYARTGDLPALICLLLCAAVLTSIAYVPSLDRNRRGA